MRYVLWSVRLVGALVVVSLALLALTNVALGHPGNTWYWSVQRAEYTLMTSIRAENILRAYDVTWADCEPMGKSIRHRTTGQPLYKHFECQITYTRSEEVCDEYSCWDETTEYEWIRVLHITGRFTFSLASA